VVGARQTKVSELDDAVPIDENVGGLEVSEKGERGRIRAQRGVVRRGETVEVPASVM
jgi:hypothetical protein